MKPNQKRNQSEISKSTYELDAIKASNIVSLELDDLAELLDGGLGRGPEDLGVLEMSEVVGGLEEQKLFHAEGRLLVMVLREVDRARSSHASVSLYYVSRYPVSVAIVPAWSPWTFLIVITRLEQGCS